PVEEELQAVERDQGRAADLDELDLAAPHQLVDARTAESGEARRLGDAHAERIRGRGARRGHHALPGPCPRRRRAKALSPSRKPASMAGISSVTGSSSP